MKKKLSIRRGGLACERNGVEWLSRGRRETAGRVRGFYGKVGRATGSPPGEKRGEGRERIGRAPEGGGEGYEGTQRGRNRDQSWLSDSGWVD